MIVYLGKFWKREVEKMEYSLQKIGGSKVEIAFSIGKEEWTECINQTYEKNKHKYKIEGFRSGKVPFKLLVNRYGIEIFYEDAMDYALNHYYGDILKKEENIEVIEQPEIDVKTVGEDGLSAVFTVAIYPDVVLGQYTDLEIRKLDTSVTDEQIQAEIGKARESHARWIDISGRTVKVGDRITLDYSGSVDGVLFDGGTAEKASLDIGAGQFIPGFEDQLVGVAIGGEKDVLVTFPAEYHSAELAGKNAVFKCKVHDIKEKQLPEIDDEFAKDLGEFDNLDQYKKSVREGLEVKAQEKAKFEEENLLIEKITSSTQIDVPDVLIKQEIERMINDFSVRMSYSGIKFEDYLKYIGSDLEKFKEEHKTEALDSVKARLVLEAIIRKEGIAVEKEEVDREVQKIAEEEGKDIEIIKKDLKENQISRIMNKIIGDKLFAFLRKSNKFV